jgi:hypothetical protein
VNSSKCDLNPEYLFQSHEIVHPDAVQTAIDKGLDYLSQHQYPNGSFCCYIAADEPMLNWAVPDSAVFPTLLIASSLIPLSKTAGAEQMLSKVSDYIYWQMHRGGVWPFFSNLHPLHKIVPYETDSLAYASSFMQDRGLQRPDHSNKPLLLANRHRKGLFYTWFIIHPRLHTNKTYWRLTAKRLMKPISNFFFWRAYESAPDDVDLGVNANILAYLGDIPETATVIGELVRVILEGKEDDCDKWYRNPFTIYYFISRAYHRGVKKLEPVVIKIIDRIIATASNDGQLGKSILDTALGVTTLINLGFKSKELHQVVRFLIKNQESHGEWPRWLFFYGGPKLLQGWGSEELTTAVCLEAIARYQNVFLNGDR